LNGTTRVARLLFLVTILLGSAWLSEPRSALAHAKLIRTVPSAGSLLNAAPERIELYLSEGINLDITEIRLLDRSRREYPLTPPTNIGGEAETVQVSLTEPVEGGTYTVVWRVLSAVDGHVTAGSFAFRVRGTDGAAEPEDPIQPVEGMDGEFGGSSPTPDPLRWLARALIFGSLALLLGGPILSLLIIEPTTGERKDGPGARLWVALGRSFGSIGAFAAVILFLALVLDLLLQVSSITGGGVGEALGRGDLALTVLNSTRYGLTWTLRAVAAFLLLAMMLFIWLGSRSGGSGVWELAVASASLAMVAQSLGSHAAALTDAGVGGDLPLPIVADWLHLVMVGAWVGGLGYLALALFPTMRRLGLPWDERRDFLARAVPRFSRLAIVSVVILAATGTLNLILHTNDLAAILGSTYGQVLLVKVGAYAVLVAIGAINLRRLTPMLKAKLTPSQEDNVSAPPVRRLRRNIFLEIGVASVALLLAGGLTLIPPPTGAAGGAPPAVSETPIARTPVAEATAAPAVSEAVVGGYRLRFTAQPSLEGDRMSLTVERTDPSSPPLTDVTKILFRIIPQDIDAGSASYTAEQTGDASVDRQEWGITEQVFTLDGAYLLTAIVQRTQTEDLRTAFRMVLAEDGSLTASPAEIVDIALLTEPSPPVNGPAHITLLVTDAEGQPITDAKITVNPFMPAHAHVEPVSIAEPKPGSPGEYTTDVTFDMGGAWLFVFNVERPGQPPLKVDASIDVEGPEFTPTP
jgi:copper transport protein